jgi:hypothetical protein
MQHICHISVGRTFACVRLTCSWRLVDSCTRFCSDRSCLPQCAPVELGSGLVFVHNVRDRVWGASLQSRRLQEQHTISEQVTLRSLLCSTTMT